MQAAKCTCTHTHALTHVLIPAFKLGLEYVHFSQLCYCPLVGLSKKKTDENPDLRDCDPIEALSP